MTTYDVLVLGAGPAGLQAALTLGRGRKRVRVLDAGVRRNAAAVHVQNFLSRDGTPPAELRGIGRAQLATYPNVEVGDARVDVITGTKGAFVAQGGGETIYARRVVLATGMIDERLPIEGFEAHWGTSIVQCPYCHGWEAREGRWGCLVRDTHALAFPMLLRGWASEVTAFVDPALDVPADARARWEAAGIRVETSPVRRLLGSSGALESVQLENGTAVSCDLLYAHPPQRQVDVVRALGLALDERGYVRVDPTTRETSIPGIYAAGDLTTHAQAAILAAASGMAAGAALNLELTVEQVTAAR